MQFLLQYLVKYSMLDNFSKMKYVVRFQIGDADQISVYTYMGVYECFRKSA